jgi:hypothetical protein
MKSWRIKAAGYLAGAVFAAAVGWLFSLTTAQRWPWVALGAIVAVSVALLLWGLVPRMAGRRIEGSVFWSEPPPVPVSPSSELAQAVRLAQGDPGEIGEAIRSLRG